MRPVRKKAANRYTDGEVYMLARPGLVERLGAYCSYCERHLQTNPAVEHIQPKDLHPHLERRWENFLLSCVNCNSLKATKDMPLTAWLIPDRDNTFAALIYKPDGIVEVSSGLSQQEAALAQETINIVELNKAVVLTGARQGALVSLDRRTQRMETTLMAKRYREKWETCSTAESQTLLGDSIIDLAVERGYFSVWMTVFDGISEIRCRLIASFVGTDTGCFDPITSMPRRPHGNHDCLPDGGKA